MAQQFWVKVSDRVQGPFSAGQLRQLAAQGKLKPTHKVSQDSRHWILASRVEGLAFVDNAAQGSSVSAPRRAEAPTQASTSGVGDASSRAQGSNDLWDELPGPAPVAQSASPLGGKLTPESAADGAPMRDESEAVGDRSMNFRCLGLGVALALVFGPMFALPWFALAMATGGDSNAKGTVFFAFLAIGIGFAIAATAAFALGTNIGLRVSRQGDGRVSCRITRRFAFLPAVSRVVEFKPRDCVEKRLKPLTMSSLMGEALVDVVLVFSVIATIPGVLFWIHWWKKYKQIGSACTVSVWLALRELKRPIRLAKRYVPEYYGTRYGDPKELREILRAVGDLTGLPVTTKESV